MPSRCALSGIARAKQSRPIGPATPTRNASRVEYEHEYAGVVEWYQNRADGLEQGFDIAQRPLASAVSSSDPLELRIETGGEFVLTEVGAERVVLRDELTASVLSLGALHTIDARGRVLPTHFALRDAQLTIVVEDRGAEYPITVDPLVVNESTKLDLSYVPQGRFGYSFDILGLRAAVGAPGTPETAGAVLRLPLAERHLGARNQDRVCERLGW